MATVGGGRGGEGKESWRGREGGGGGGGGERGGRERGRRVGGGEGEGGRRREGGKKCTQSHYSMTASIALCGYGRNFPTHVHVHDSHPNEATGSMVTSTALSVSLRLREKRPEEANEPLILRSISRCKSWSSNERSNDCREKK